MDIRPWLQELYAPAVLVAATPAAEALVQAKNGLGLVDLLRPYSSVYQLNVPVRVGETSVRVQDMRIRFFDVATMYQPPPEAIEDHLQEVLRTAAQRHAKLDPAPDLLQRFMSGNPPDIRELTPWFDAYRSEFLRLLRFGDHETLDYPVACVFAIPADVVNPASHLDTLVGQLVLPPLMQQDVMYSLRDKDFPRHYMLLLDVAAGMNEKRALDNLAAIRKLYGEAHCSLLRINSGNGDRAHSGAPVDFFALYQHACLPSGGAGEPLARPPPPAGGVGAYLTVQDLDGVAAFVRDFMTRTMLPRLEERMARLNAAITATRRGLRNRLNRFWKGSAEDRQNEKPYPWHSVEGQMRQLGDLAFLLRQYAFAESTYRLAAQDYLAENNYRWYAGVEEMIGLCSVLGEPTDPIAAVLLQNDPMKYFMRAYENYSKPPAAVLAAAAAAAAAATAAASVTTTAARGANGGTLITSTATTTTTMAAASVAVAPPPPAAVAASKMGRMLATRVILLGAAVQTAAGRHRATSDALMRAQSEEENGRAGLLLEQSAYAMLYTRPPLVRKFAFQMVLAGIRYICCGQKRIAIHAYRQVLGIYLGKKWRHIEEHLHAVLGAQCVEYGDKERALWHFCALLDCGHRPPAQQSAHVGQFLSLLADVRDQVAILHDGVSLVDSLPLPLVNRHDLRVLCSDTACYAGPAARTVPDSTWQKMEALCCSNGSTNWLVEGGAKQERDHEEFTTCVCGEEVGVQVEFRNPLAVKLKVTNVKLICTFTPEGDTAAAHSQAAVVTHGSAAAGSPGGSATPVEGVHPLLPGSAPASISTQPGSEFLHIPEAQFTLHPGEALVEVLRVLPRVPGWLRVTGVVWTLNGVAHGRIAFDVKGRRRKKPKGTRPGQLKHYPPHRRLLFQVVPTMPRLELLADPLPPALYSGELCRVLMRIRNCGGLPLRALALVVGHPEAVCPATDANKDRPLLDSLMDPREVVQLSRVPAASAAAGSGGAFVRPSMQLYRLWPGRELAPGEVLEWPLWLHPRGVGTLKLPLVWYGEPAAVKCGMRHRTLRICGSVSVQPLLAARPAVWPSPTRLSHHQLRLAIDNSKEGERVVLQQLAAVTAPPQQQQQQPGRGSSSTVAAVTPAAPPAGTATAVGSQPHASSSSSSSSSSAAGWRMALLGSQSFSSAGAAAEAAGTPAATAPDAGGGAGGKDGATATAGAAKAPHARSLPLALPLQPGESASLFLQLIAPPPAPAPSQSQRPGGSVPAAGNVAMGGGGGGGAAAGGVLSPPPSGMTTPGQQSDGDSTTSATAVAQAAEAVRALALDDGFGGQPSGPLPYVYGSDASLQRLNLFGPGVLAHFYRRGRRSMVTVTGGVATAAGSGPAGAVPPGGVAAARAGGAQAPGGMPGAAPQPQPGTFGMGPSQAPGMQPGGRGLAASASFSPGQTAPHHGAPPPLQYPQQPLMRGASFGPVGAAAAAAAAAVPGIAPGGFQPGGGPQAGGGHVSGRPQGPGGAPAAVPAGAPGGSGPGRPQGQVLPLADPPLDLLLLWHVAASQRTGPHQGQQRLGLCRPYDPQSGRDLSGCLQAQTAPIRMLLTGPNGASSAASGAGSAGPVVRHDFRRSSLAVVPLRLVVRNNTAVEARLQIEVGDGWQSTDAPHSWQASTGILGQSPGAVTGMQPSSSLALSHHHQASSTLHAHHPHHHPHSHHHHSPGSGLPAMPVAAGNTGGGLMSPGGPVSAGITGGSTGGGGGGMGGSAGLLGGGGQQGGPGGSMLGISYQAGLPPCPEYTWVGPSCVAVPRVPPGGEVEVALSVAVFRPGAYCVSGYRCTAYMEAAGAVEVQRGEPLCFRVEG